PAAQLIELVRQPGVLGGQRILDLGQSFPFRATKHDGELLLTSRNDIHEVPDAIALHADCGTPGSHRSRPARTRQPGDWQILRVTYMWASIRAGRKAPRRPPSPFAIGSAAPARRGGPPSPAPPASG